jgi:hypothetical protein
VTLAGYERARWTPSGRRFTFDEAKTKVLSVVRLDSNEADP